MTPLIKYITKYMYLVFVQALIPWLPLWLKLQRAHQMIFVLQEDQYVKTLLSDRHISMILTSSKSLSLSLKSCISDIYFMNLWTCRTLTALTCILSLSLALSKIICISDIYFMNLPTTWGINKMFFYCTVLHFSSMSYNDDNYLFPLLHNY